jgi:HK97 family phage major capsid protein
MKELRDKRNKLLKDAQALLIKDGVTAEEIASSKRMISEADAIEERVGVMESVASKLAADGALPKIPRGDPGSGTGASADESRAAFADFIRYGDKSPVLRSYTPTDAQKETRTQRPGREQRDLTTSTGGYFVPQEFYPVLTQAEKAWGSILPELNTKKTDNGAPMKIAFSNDTGNLLMLDSEPSSMSEVEPGLSSLLLSTDALKTNIIKVTLAELQDSAFDLDAFIRDIFQALLSRPDEPCHQRHLRGLSFGCPEYRVAIDGGLRCGDDTRYYQAHPVGRPCGHIRRS